MSIEIHSDTSPPIKCRSLESACNRRDELTGRNWLVDTDALRPYEVKRPGKRLAGVVYVHTRQSAHLTTIRREVCAYLAAHPLTP